MLICHEQVWFISGMHDLFNIQKLIGGGNSLAVQWLGLHASTIAGKIRGVEIDGHIHFQLIFDKDAKVIRWREESLSFQQMF